MPLADAAAARNDPFSTWAIAQMRQATRPSWLRDASRRSFDDDSSSRVTSILRPIMSTAASRAATCNRESDIPTMGTSKSKESQDYWRLVLLVQSRRPPDRRSRQRLLRGTLQRADPRLTANVRSHAFVVVDVQQFFNYRPKRNQE